MKKTIGATVDRAKDGVAPFPCFWLSALQLGVSQYGLKSFSVLLHVCSSNRTTQLDFFSLNCNKNIFILVLNVIYKVRTYKNAFKSVLLCYCLNTYVTRYDGFNGVQWYWINHCENCVLNNTIEDSPKTMLTITSYCLHLMLSPFGHYRPASMCCRIRRWPLIRSVGYICLTMFNKLSDYLAVTNTKIVFGSGSESLQNFVFGTL